MSMAVRADGALLALDYNTQTVHLFQPQTQTWHAFSSPWVRNGRVLRIGRGSGDDEVAYLGTLGPTVLRFAQLPAEAPEALARPDRVWHLPVDVSDLCRIDNYLAIRGTGLVDDGVVRLYSTADTSLVAAFGRGYDSDAPRIRAMLSDGLVACDPVAKTLVVGFYYLPFVQAYDLSGRLLWTSYLADFVPATFAETVTRSGERTLQRQIGDYETRLLSLTPIEGGMILLQLAELMLSPAGRQRVSGVQTFLLSVDDGAGVYIGGDVPRILSSRARHLWGTGSREEEPIRVVRVDF